MSYQISTSAVIKWLNFFHSGQKKGINVESEKELGQFGPGSHAVYRHLSPQQIYALRFSSG